MKHNAKLFLSGLIAGFAASPVLASGSVQMALVPLGDLNVEISSTCEGEIAIFRVTNTGGDMTSSITFNIFQVTDGELISKRSMRMNENQTATFKVNKAGEIADQVGLFLESPDRVFLIDADAAVRCS